MHSNPSINIIFHHHHLKCELSKIFACFVWRVTHSYSLHWNIIYRKTVSKGSRPEIINILLHTQHTISTTKYISTLFCLKAICLNFIWRQHALLYVKCPLSEYWTDTARVWPVLWELIVRCCSGHWSPVYHLHTWYCITVICIDKQDTDCFSEFNQWNV